MPIDDGTIADDETVTWQTLRTVYKELIRRFEEFRTAGSSSASATIGSEFVTSAEHGSDSTPGHHPPETGTSTTHSHEGGSALTVQEEDGTPIDTAVTIIRVPNGGLTDNGAGDVSLGFAIAGAAPTAHGIAAHTAHANWKVLYTDGSGDEQELALGADGTVLTSTGASTAPAFEAAAGGGGSTSKTWAMTT